MDTALVLGALVIAGATLLGFVAVERSHTHPLINLTLLRRRGFADGSHPDTAHGRVDRGGAGGDVGLPAADLARLAACCWLVIAPQGVVGFVTGMLGARLIRRFGMRRLLVAATAAVGIGFLLLSQLPTSGHYSARFAAVLLIGFGTVGTVFGTTVMAASGMAQSDQGLVGGVVNTTRQVGAAVGVAALVAIAEGSNARSGIASVGGDRAALFVAALVGFSGTLVALFGARADAPMELGAAASQSPTFAQESHITTMTTRTQ